MAAPDRIVALIMKQFDEFQKVLPVFGASGIYGTEGIRLYAEARERRDKRAMDAALRAATIRALVDLVIESMDEEHPDRRRRLIETLKEIAPDWIIELDSKIRPHPSQGQDDNSEKA